MQKASQIDLLFFSFIGLEKFWFWYGFVRFWYGFVRVVVLVESFYMHPHSAPRPRRPFKPAPTATTVRPRA